MIEEVEGRKLRAGSRVGVLSSEHNMTLTLMNSHVAVVTCTRPAQDLACQHSLVYDRRAHEAILEAKGC